jgi:hypothetical protein
MTTKTIEVSLDYVEAFYVKASSRPIFRMTYEEALNDGFEQMARKQCSAFEVNKQYIVVDGYINGAPARNEYNKRTDVLELVLIFDNTPPTTNPF